MKRRRGTVGIPGRGKGRGLGVAVGGPARAGHGNSVMCLEENFMWGHLELWLGRWQGDAWEA